MESETSYITVFSDLIALSFVVIMHEKKYNQNRKERDIRRIINLVCMNFVYECYTTLSRATYNGVIKWKHCLRYQPFLRVFHQSPVDYPHKGQWWGALMLSLICAWPHGWANIQDARDLRRHCAHRDFTVMNIYQKNIAAVVYIVATTWCIPSFCYLDQSQYPHL